MNNVKLTTAETKLLNEIVGMYDEDCNTCFTRQLTQKEKGVVGSLVKKGLIYDSFEGEPGYGHNFYPVITDEN